MIKMEIEGGDKLMKAMRDAGLDVDKTVAASLIAGCFIISNDAKRLAPKLSGNLARSIHIGTKTRDITKAQPDSDGVNMREMPADMGAVATVANTLKKGGQAEILVGTDVVYADVQEFAAFQHKIGQSPYLRPALDNNKTEVRDEVKRAIQSVLRKVGM